jgi:hypothetical protein
MLEITDVKLPAKRAASKKKDQEHADAAEAKKDAAAASE